MPAGIDGADSGRFEVLHKVEGIVIKWAHQIKSVLDLKPEQALLDGKNPGPIDEIKFWADMAGNLQCIYDQLSEGRVRRLAALLKEKVLIINYSLFLLTKINQQPNLPALKNLILILIKHFKESSYFQSLDAMYTDVRVHLEEARDISMHLKPIASLLDDIEQTDFNEIEPKLSALYHLVCLIWASSDYYRRPARAVILLQEIGNFLIELVKTYLDPDNILKVWVIIGLYMKHLA